METSDFIALGALVVAVFGYAHNLWAIRSERDDRRESLRLLRQQVGVELEGRREQRRA